MEGFVGMSSEGAEPGLGCDAREELRYRRDWGAEILIDWNIRISFQVHQK